MASHNTLRNADIHDMIPDAMPLDGIALWSNILAECGYDKDGDDGLDAVDEMTQNDDAHLTRDTIISARLCDDDYFYSSYVRTDEWKVSSPYIHSQALSPCLCRSVSFSSETPPRLRLSTLTTLCVLP